jgi:hypothetical protein
MIDGQAFGTLRGQMMAIKMRAHPTIMTGMILLTVFSFAF